jgi:cytochrome P450
MPPTVAPSPLSARAFFRDPVGYVSSRRDSAALTRLAAGPSRYALVRDPDAIWRVLVADADSYRQGKWKHRARRFVGDTLNTLDGEEHRRRRRLLDPVLDRGRVARFAPAIVARVERRQAEWRDGDRIVLRDELDPLALTMAGDVLLSTDLESRSAELARALALVMRRVPRFTPPLVGTRQGRALARVDRVISTLIDQRRRSGGTGDDLVAVLLEGGLPERTIRGELIVFLLAAVDEPPSGLEAAWYLLGRSPAADERLHMELEDVLGDRTPTLDDAAKLPYLDAVLRETLRLFPPARHIDRCPVDQVEIGDRSVRAGSNVIVSPLVTHQDPELYEHPSEFVPERWLGSAKRSRGGYLPFGAGAHACIGAPLARTMMILILASVGRRWRLRLEPGTEAPSPRARRLPVTLEAR